MKSMKAGAYYVGDLWFVMRERWNEITELTEGQFTLKDGTDIAVFNTINDDAHHTSTGAMLQVDSNSIGCVLIDDVDHQNRCNNPGYMDVMVADQEFSAWADENFIYLGDNYSIYKNNIE